LDGFIPAASACRQAGPAFCSWFVFAVNFVAPASCRLIGLEHFVQRRITSDFIEPGFSPPSCGWYFFAFDFVAPASCRLSRLEQLVQQGASIGSIRRLAVWFNCRDKFNDKFL
jgi:hypothetical protein